MPSSTSCDVAVVGGGLAGKAASLHLARAGLKVLCIEPIEEFRPPLGESLDWSAPGLLAELGLPMEKVVGDEMGTWKRHVTLRMEDCPPTQYEPSSWLGRAPLHVGLHTLHVDRFRLDKHLIHLTSSAGVAVLRERAVAVERSADRVESVRTDRNTRICAKWFIDASGLASVFARAFELPAVEFGPAKVALWTYVAGSGGVDGTTLYMDPKPSRYLDWIWEIPIHAKTVSVGYIASGDSIKEKRQSGLSNEEIFRKSLARFERFKPLARSETKLDLNVTSFRCRTYRKASGANWLIAGEAASMVDPITANGVTAALRHAEEAAAIILQARGRDSLPVVARRCYDRRIFNMARFFNDGIERMVYEPWVRSSIGMSSAGTVYTSPAWSMNLVYARLKPRGLLRTLLLNSTLGALRSGWWLLRESCRMIQPREA